MAFIVGRLTAWHRLCSVPVDLTEWVPDGRKVLSSESADISILPNPAHTPSCCHPPWISSLFLFLSPPRLFSLALTSRCIWLMLPDPLRSPGSCSPLLGLNAGVNHRNYHSVLHLSSLLLSFLLLCLSSDILSPHHWLFYWYRVAIVIVDISTGSFKVNHKVRLAMSAALTLTHSLCPLPFFSDLMHYNPSVQMCWFAVLFNNNPLTTYGLVLFILIIVWIFHACDLWIKYRMEVDMIELTFIHLDWWDSGTEGLFLRKQKGKEETTGSVVKDINYGQIWQSWWRWWWVILNRRERWFYLLPVSMSAGVR